METTLVLYVYQKNIDLHAMSAKEAMVNDLGETMVSKLHRFDRWTVTFDETSHADAGSSHDQLEKVLSQSFFIVNPNKQSYTLGQAPKKRTAQSDVGFRVEVQQKIAQTFDIERINKNCGVSITSLNHELVWDIYVTPKPGENPEDLESHVKEQLVVTTSHHKGLLVNPVSENYSFQAINIPTS